MIDAKTYKEVEKAYKEHWRTPPDYEKQYEYRDVLVMAYRCILGAMEAVEWSKENEGLVDAVKIYDLYTTTLYQQIDSICIYKCDIINWHIREFNAFDECPFSGERFENEHQQGFANLHNLIELLSTPIEDL